MHYNIHQQGLGRVSKYAIAGQILVRFPNPLATGSGLGLQYPWNRIILLWGLPELSIWPTPLSKQIYWNRPCMESIFSVDRTFIHASVAELQPLDGHLQFVRWAPPVCPFRSQLDHKWISHRLDIPYFSAGFSCIFIGPTALFLYEIQKIHWFWTFSCCVMAILIVANQTVVYCQIQRLHLLQNLCREAQQAASEGLGWEQAWKEEPD